MPIRSHFRDNAIKNILILVIAGVMFPFLEDALGQIKPAEMGDFLLIISILLVTICFENFAFTYEKGKLHTRMGKFLSHGITFISMTLTALLLESMVLAVKVVYPSFFLIILGFSVLLYLSIALYDFWDLARNEDFK